MRRNPVRPLCFLLVNNQTNLPPLPCLPPDAARASADARPLQAAAAYSEAAPRPSSPSADFSFGFPPVSGVQQEAASPVLTPGGAATPAASLTPELFRRSATPLGASNVLAAATPMLFAGGGSKTVSNVGSQCSECSGADALLPCWSVNACHTSPLPHIHIMPAGAGGLLHALLPHARAALPVRRRILCHVAPCHRHPQLW